MDGLASVLPRLGYVGASTKEIAKAAGLSSGLVHHHFANKEEILLELVETLKERLFPRNEDLLAPRLSLDGLLRAYLEVQPEEAWRAEAAQCWIVIGSEALHRPEVRRVYSAALTELQNEIERRLCRVLQEDGLAESGARAFATTLIASIEGYLRVGILSPALIESGSALKNIRELVQGWLAGQPKSQLEVLS